MENEWYIIFEGRQEGPMNKMQLLNYGLNMDSQVWRPGMAEWTTAGAVPELVQLIPAQNYDAGASGYPAAYPTTQPTNRYDTGKSKVVAGVLAILLGGLGIQYFYCGKIGAGFLCILLTVVTCGCWEIVTFIQGILMLTMSDVEFNRKYVLTDKMLPIF